MASTIFVIDSSPAVRRMVEQISTPEGYEVVGFQDGPTALEAARKISPRLIIADYHLDNMTFSGFCKEVQKHDTLSDTYIISLVGAGDRLDESHLRSLGVKAFLKKPFQTENLLELIKDLDQVAAQSNGSAKKRRVWPPVSSATDSDDEDLAEGFGEEEQTGEIDVPPIIPSLTQKETPMAPNPLSKSAADPEEAMKGLFGQLLQSMTEKAEKKLAELLPQLIAKDLTAHLSKAVEGEVHQQLGASVTQERLAETIEPMLAKELPKVLSRELPTLEPIIRHSVFEIANPLIQEQIERVVREQVDTLKQAVPDAIREHLKSIDQLVQEEVRKAAVAQTERCAEDIVRTAAQDQVQQTVERMVPKIAEEQVTTEIRRLSAAA